MKTVFFWVVLMALGFVLTEVPGAMPKKPILWLDGPQVTWQVLNQGVEVSIKESISSYLARLISAPNSQVFYFLSSHQNLFLLSHASIINQL